MDTPTLVVARRFDANGKSSPLATLPDIPATAPETGFDWIHLDAGAGDVATELQRLGASEFVTEALLAADTRPRCLSLGETALVNLRGVNLNPDNAPEDMVSIRIWLSENRILSVRRRRLRAVTDLVESVDRGLSLKTPASLVAGVSLRLIDRMNPTITALNEAVDDLEDLTLDGQHSNARIVIADLRREATMLRRYLAPQRDALSSLALQQFAWITDRDRNALRDAADQTTRLTEDLDAVRERAAIIRDQIAETRADQMNRHTMILSIAAAIFLPLGLLAGMLGMNVGGLPGVDEPLAFWWVTGGLTITGGGLALLFKWARWI